MEQGPYDWPTGDAGEKAYQILLRSGLRRMANRLAASQLTAADWTQALEPFQLLTRVCFVMRLMFGMTDAEIGQFFGGVSKGAINERLNKAMFRLGRIHGSLMILDPDNNRRFPPRGQSE